MDISCIEAFVAVAEEMNFSAGAERLYMSQPTISKYVHNLEAELETELFDRSHRQIRLTPQGDRLLPYAKKMLSQYHELLQTAKGGQALRIAMLPVADSYGFPQLLAEYSAKHPLAAFQLEERQNAAILKLLENDNLDGAFCRLLSPFQTEKDAVIFCREELVLLVQDEGQEETAVDLGSFRNHRFIFLARDTGLWDASLALCTRAGFAPDICYTGSARGNITRLVGEGTGVALLAESVAVECLRPGIRILHLSQSVESMLAFVPSKRSGNTQLQELLDFLKDHK